MKSFPIRALMLAAATILPFPLFAQAPSAAVAEAPDAALKRLFVDSDEASLKPVSYTHLDVYKRQLDGRGEAGCGRDRVDRVEGEGRAFALAVARLVADCEGLAVKFLRQFRRGACLLYTSRCV